MESPLYPLFTAAFVYAILNQENSVGDESVFIEMSTLKKEMHL